MKIYEIDYNDGTFAERIEFDESCTEEFINDCLRKTIKEYNESGNKDYHITMENIKEITTQTANLIRR